MTSFELTTHYHPYLPEGANDLRAVVTVTALGTDLEERAEDETGDASYDPDLSADGDADGDADGFDDDPAGDTPDDSDNGSGDGISGDGPDGQTEAAPGRAIVLIGDTSGSMATVFRADSVPVVSRIAAMRVALVAAIRALEDGTEFAIIAGNHRANAVYPETGLATADADTRAEAIDAVATLTASGGTAMSTWLRAARERFAEVPDAIKLAVLVTDGSNESDVEGRLDRELGRCAGLFQCECRGVGDSWEVDELRSIASALLGDVEMIRTPEQLAADFNRVMATTMAKTTADVRLQIWVPTRSELSSFGQVAPSVDDYAPHARLVEDRTIEFPCGSWDSESRDFILSLQMDAGDIGDEMLAARVSLVIDGDTVATAMLPVTWSDNPALVSQMDATVAHYTGQARLARAIQKGLAYRAEGRNDRALRALGIAVQLAHESDHLETLELLGRIVEIVDPAAGEIRLRESVDAADEMELETRSTKTVRVRREP